MSSAVILAGESMEAYHASPCISSSKLKVFKEGGPALYHGRYVTRTIPQPEPTEALILGCAFDTLVTESRKAFAERYIIKPEGMSFATKDGKAWREQHCTSGQPILSWDQWTMFEEMEHAIHQHPLFRELIHPECLAQVTVRKEQTSFGFGLQCRPDWLSLKPCELSEGRPYSVNLKTTVDWSDWFDDADPHSFRSGAPVYKFGYHRQAALDQWTLFQADEVGESRHFLLVVEKQQPFRVGVVQLTDEYLEAGFADVEIDLLRLKRCYDLKVWPKAPVSVVRLTPPNWLLESVARKSLARDAS